MTWLDPSCHTCRFSAEHTLGASDVVCQHPLTWPRCVDGGKPRVPECGPDAVLYVAKPRVPDPVGQFCNDIGYKFELLRQADLITEQEADEAARLLYDIKKRAVRKVIEAEDKRALNGVKSSSHD